MAFIFDPTFRRSSKWFRISANVSSKDKRKAPSFPFSLQILLRICCRQIVGSSFKTFNPTPLSWIQIPEIRILTNVQIHRVSFQNRIQKNAADLLSFVIHIVGPFQFHVHAISLFSHSDHFDATNPLPLFEERLNEWLEQLQLKPRNSETAICLDLRREKYTC